MQNHMELVVRRTGEDRRNGELREPPYMTSEGMVLCDRRSHQDRRNEPGRSLLASADLLNYVK